MARRNGKPHGIRITVLLITAMTTLVTLSTGLVLFLSEKAAFRNTFELLQQSGAATIQRLEDGIRVHVSPAGRIVEHVANLVASGELDPTDRPRTDHRHEGRDGRHAASRRPGLLGQYPPRPAHHAHADRRAGFPPGSDRRARNCSN